MALVFFKREEICYKMVYYTLHLRKANRQKSCYKVRLYTDFSESGIKG